MDSDGLILNRSFAVHTSMLNHARCCVHACTHTKAHAMQPQGSDPAFSPTSIARLDRPFPVPSALKSAAEMGAGLVVMNVSSIPI